MAGYKKDSPSKFSARALGAGVAGLKGLFDKDLKGQGFGARLKNAGAAVGNELLGADVFQTQDMQAAAAEKGAPQESGMGGIHSKLDKLLQISGQGEDTPNMDTMSTSSTAAPLAMAAPAKFKEFMQSTTQSPISNDTGGKNPNFKFGEADRMMAVADPNVDTKGALFMTKPGPGDKAVSVKPYAETKGEDPVTGYTKNKAGVKVNLANLPVNLKVGFDQKNTGYKSSISPSIVIGGKIKLKGKKQEKPKFT